MPLDKRRFMPLPPGMVPSDSRENMLQVLSEQQDHSLLQNNKIETTGNVIPSNKENVELLNGCAVTDAWSPSINKDTSIVTNNTKKGHSPTFHIDLNTEVKDQSIASTAGTTKVKISGPTWSPMRHKNRIVPTTSGEKERPSIKLKNPVLSSSEGSLLADDSKKGISTTPCSTRPYSAPGVNNNQLVTGVVVTDEGEIEGTIEIHDSFNLSTPGPPVYSEVVKSDLHEPTYAEINHKSDTHSPSLTPELPPRFGEEEKSRYIESLVAMSPETYGPSPLKRTTSNTSSIIRVLQDRAEIQVDNDSLYDSMDERNNEETADGAREYSEIPDVDPRYFKGLKKHDDKGNVRLISVQGVAVDSSNEDLITPIQQSLPLGMQTIHYLSAIGDKKALESLLSLLPIIQAPIDMVLGNKRFKMREGVNVRDDQGRTPLMHAVYNGHKGCVGLLAEAGANLSIEAADGSSCLHHAAFSGTPQMIAILLSHGANGMKKDNEGRVPLHWAANNEDPQCLTILLDKVPGLGSNIQDNSKMTPLMWSAYYGQTQNIEVLKKRGADTTISDVDGMKAIHWSIISKNTRTLQILLSTESSGYRDNKGRTVMHVAAEQGFSRAVEMIRSTRPLSVNDQDSNRRTPLHWATVCEKPELIRALTTAGADPALYDSKRMTALNYAISRGLHYCGLLLAQAIEERHDREAAIGYHHVLSVGEAASIGVRTLIQQEGKLEETDIGEITEEQLVQLKTVCTGGWINKFTSNGKGPLHCRFFWIDPNTMTFHWSKNIESRYIPNKDIKSDKLLGVRTSASTTIIQRRDFEPLDKHKYTFTIFTNNKVLDMVAMSSDDYRVWLNGIQLLLHLGSEMANELMNHGIPNRS